MSDDEQAASPSPPERGTTTDAPASGGGAREPDIAMIGGATEHGVQILRLRQGQIELGELRAAQEGKPILGESVRLHAREDHPGVYDVETVARGPLAKQPAARAAPPPARKGPAKVSSDAYRSGWDSIFEGAGRKPDGDLPN